MGAAFDRPIAEGYHETDQPRDQFHGHHQSIPAPPTEVARMIRVDARKPVRFCDGLSRRDFLHAGSLACLGLG